MITFSTISNFWWLRHNRNQTKWTVEWFVHCQKVFSRKNYRVELVFRPKKTFFLYRTFFWSKNISLIKLSQYIDILGRGVKLYRSGVETAETFVRRRSIVLVLAVYPEGEQLYSKIYSNCSGAVTTSTFSTYK